MPLASEDKMQIRELTRTMQRTCALLVDTNGLLKEILENMKNPPMTIERGTALEKMLVAQQHQCTCGIEKTPCPVHE